MTTELKPGARFRSAVCTTEVIVVRSPGGELDLRCGGHPLVALGQDPPVGLELKPGMDAGSAIGKRYTDEAGTLELLCTKAGQGTLSTGDVALQLKDAKPLPSSD